MNKIIGGFFLILMALSISSCKSDLDSLADGHHRGLRLKHQPQVKTIKMSFGGDYITESEEPLLRAEGDGDTFVGINVFYTEVGKSSDDEQPYAYGLFSNPSTISIDLLTGYTYRFEATILIERVDEMYEEPAYPEYFYGEPFKVNNGQNAGFKKSDMEKFIYTYEQSSDQRYYFTDLDKGTAFVSTGNDLSAKYVQLSYPRVKRYYGKLDKFELTNDEIESITIPIDYKSFGLKFVLENIPTNTNVSVQDISDDTHYSPTTQPERFLVFHNGVNLNSSSEESKSWEGLFSLNDLKTNSHEFTLKFTWDKGHGDAETFTYKLNAEAKKMKILKIQVTGDVSQIKKGNIIFSSLDDNLDEEEVEISKNF